MDSVIGIDLSGLWGNREAPRTVAVRLNLDSKPRVLDMLTVRRGPKGDAELMDWCVARNATIIGIDAPLTLPHSVQCDLDACERCQPGEANYLIRDVDRRVGGMPTVMLAAISFRGIYLARRLRATGASVIEVYPRASFRSLGWDGRSATVEEGWRLISSLVDDVDVGTRDDLDAICAALVAAQVGQGRAQEEPGSDGSMWVAVP